MRFVTDVSCLGIYLSCLMFAIGSTTTYLTRLFVNPMNRMHKHISIIAILLFSFGLELRAQSFSMTNGRNHPEIEWITAETDHFVIIYPSHLAGIEAEAAAIAEATYESLSELLSVTFDYKIPVYLSDQDEIVNGFAVPFDRAYTQIWVALNEKTVFSSNEKWLRKVLAHELAHIFHFEAVKSNVGLLGNLPAMRQNWTEGFAQYSTEKWDAKRGDALLRTAIFEDRYDFNRGESIKDRGLVYAAGNSQLRYFTYVYGDSAIGKLFADRDTLAGLIRYHNFGKAFKETTGKTYNQFNEDWSRFANIHYNTIAAYMGHSDSLDTDPLTLPGTFLTDVAYSPDTTLVAVSGYVSDRFPFHRIWVIERKKKGKTRVIYEGSDTGPLSWSPDGSTILFSRDRRGPNGSIIPDVYAVDVASGKSRRITTDLRATFPVWSIDGTQLYASVNETGTANIHRIDPLSGESTSITQHTGDVQVSSLRHHPSGPWLAFSRFDADGSRFIVILNTETNEESVFTDRLTDDRTPIWNTNGDTLVYTSLRDRVPNVFLVSFENGRVGEEIRVTNQFTGFTATHWVPSDSLHPSGTLLGITTDSKLRDRAWRIDAGMRTSVRDVPMPDYYSDWTTRDRDGMIPWSIQPDASLITNRGRYKPLREIDHVVSLPFVYFNTPTDWGFGGLTFWREPLGIHEFIVGATVAPLAVRDHSYALASYINRSFHPTLGADLFHNLFESRVYSDDFLISTQSGARVSAALPLDIIDHPFTASDVRFATALVYSKPDILTYSLPLQDNLAPPVTGTIVESELRFAIRRAKPYANAFIHPLDGMGLDVSVKSGQLDASYIQPDMKAYALIPVGGIARMYLYGRAVKRFGTSLPQEILGFNRYDEPDLGDYGIFNFGRSSTERVRGFRKYATGDVLLFGSAEFRLPIANSLQTQVLGLVSLGSTSLAAFVDAGMVGGVTNLPGVSTEQRSGAGFEIKNQTSILGLAIAQSFGAARPTNALMDDAFTDFYWRIKGSVAF